MQKSIINRVDQADIELLRDISVSTFVESFAPYNTEQNMNDYIATAFSIEKLTKELTASGSSFYFIYIDNDLAGYLKLNVGESQTELHQDSSLEIERIYILGKYQSKKLGQLLFEKAIEIAKQKMVKYVWLGVWEKNSRAIQFYQKNGFVEFDKHIFKLGDDEQLDIMMKLEI